MGTMASVQRWAGASATALAQLTAELSRHINRILPTDGADGMQAPLPLASYATADIPAAADWEGAIIYVNDASAGSQFQGSNGTSWVNLG